MGCGKRLSNCALTLVVVVLAASAGIYFWLLPRLDGLLKDALHRELMLAPSSTVEITRGSLLDTLEGQVDKLYVEASEARIDRMVVEDLVFRAEDIQFDLLKTLMTGRADLKDVTSAELSAKVSEESLRERWSEELSRKGLKQPEVKLDAEQIEVSAIVDLGLTEVRIAARGNLQIERADRVKFHVTELDVAGTTLGIEQFKADFSALTPVVDLGSLQLGVLIESVEIEDGYIKVRARSASLEERIAATEEQAKEAEAGPGKGGGWRVPSLDEVISLVKEPAAKAEDETETAEVEGEADDENAGTDDVDEDSSAEDETNGDAEDGGEE